jgi:hypothetical protein
MMDGLVPAVFVVAPAARRGRMAALLCALLAAAPLAGCGAAGGGTVGEAPGFGVAAEVPADMLNPAVTQATVGSTICVAGYTASIRPPVSYTGPLKLRQLVTYGYADRNPAAYEEDHVESLEAGGSPTAPANLYPESHSVSFADDTVENRTRADICAGRITLSAGQARLYQLKLAHGYRRAASVAASAAVR